MDESTWKSIAETLAGVTVVVGAGSAAYWKLRQLLQPLLRRRTAKIAILHHDGNQTSAREFAEILRSRGYRDVYLTAMPEALLGRQAVIIWQPIKVSLRQACMTPSA